MAIRFDNFARVDYDVGQMPLHFDLSNSVLRRRFAKMFRNAVICLILACLTAASASAKTIYGDHNTYAVIAYSPVTGKFAYSYNHYTRKGAEEEALKKCKADGSRTVVWVHAGFCALAIGRNKAWGIGWRAGEGATNKEAVEMACRNCSKYGCDLQTVICLSSDGQSIHQWTLPRPKPQKKGSHSQ